MEPDSYFIWWLAQYAPNPQGSDGTEWTVVGSAADLVVSRGTATNMQAAERVRYGLLPWPIDHGGYMHEDQNRDASVWIGDRYQTYYTLGPMSMIRAALRASDW